jgi:hypothetical protein
MNCKLYSQIQVPVPIQTAGLITSLSQFGNGTIGRALAMGWAVLEETAGLLLGLATRHTMVEDIRWHMVGCC